jgi:hypothetical protein
LCPATVWKSCSKSIQVCTWDLKIVEKKWKMKSGKYGIGNWNRGGEFLNFKRQFLIIRISNHYSLIRDAANSIIHYSTFPKNMKEIVIYFVNSTYILSKISGKRVNLWKQNYSSSEQRHPNYIDF